jgi:CheY-like chemotaxis protein
MAKITVIEDNAQSARLVAKLLTIAGHSVSIYDNGEDALTAVMETPPDLVLIDLGLPDMDGQTVIAMLRQHPGLIQTALIMFTAYPESTARAMAKAYGCTGVITKPISTRTFVKEVEVFLTEPTESPK